MSDNFPVGTVAGPGREVSAFRGRISEIPSAWELADGRTIPPERHDNPKYKGRPWKLPDLSRTFVLGTSTHILSEGNEEGKIGKVMAANQEVPGVYALVKVRRN